MSKAPETVEESEQRENDFFRSYTDRGINPFEPDIPEAPEVTAPWED